MYINTITHYLPEQIVPNSHFTEKNGLSDEWIVKRTGIKERRKASPDENTNTMAVDAVKNAVKNLPYSISEVDLIVGATFSPYDTVVDIAQSVQKHFDINKMKEGMYDLGKVSTIGKYYITTPADTERGVIDNSYDYAWIVHFKDAKNQASYQTDSLHLEFIEKYNDLWEEVQVYDSEVMGKGK